MRMAERSAREGARADRDSLAAARDDDRQAAETHIGEASDSARQLGGAGELQTFSMAYEDPRYDERKYIEQLVPLLRCTSNYSFLKPEEVFGAVGTVLWHQEQPFGGVPTIAYWKMNGLAKEKGVTVLLEGQGVDEILGGYRYFHGAMLLDLFFAGRWHRPRSAATRCSWNGSPSTWWRTRCGTGWPTSPTAARSPSPRRKRARRA